ncbi:MAG: hypothetical protein M0D53_12545 [Flavobacterium sp. JAD_PAG50586_2]|nr:MAG: hypothetical protein M0D53_12545 [Flavobacterium sp. JAD_PAG50586_2]
MNTFLLSLPAILGIVGFVIYYILKKSVTEDPVVKRIIEKLKFDEPNFASRWEGLNSAQKEEILKQDNELRDKLAAQDRFILDKALTNQFRTNIFVYTLCALLLITGIYLFLKPKPLQIDNIQIQNTDVNAQDLVVDIDPITVTWTSSGVDEEVYVVLENIDTGKQTKKIRSQASDGTIQFDSNIYTNYDKILSNRFPNGSNRIRAIIYGTSQSFKSKPFNVKVGVKIICYETLPNKLNFNAIIDQTIVSNFHFSPKITLFEDEHFNGQKMFEASSYQSEPIIIIDSPKKYMTTNLVFSVNPRDIVNEKTYRTDIESLRDAIKALQK